MENNPALRTPAASTAAKILLFFLVVYALYIARAVLIPLALALFLHFVLMPPLRFLRRLRLPPEAAAGVLLVLLIAVMVLAAARLTAPVQDWVSKTPEALRQVERKLRPWRRPVQEVSQTAERVTAIASVETNKAPEVVVKEPSAAETLLSTGGAFLSGLTVMLILLYFMLAYREAVQRSLIEMVPTFDDKARTFEVVTDLEKEVSRYLIVNTAINIAVGVVEGLAMWAVGLPNPVLWGVMAGVTNYVPYVGAVVGTAVVAFVSVVTFDTPGLMLLAPTVFYLITAIEGNFITPMILGKRLTLNPLIIFICVLFWGWIWGVAGMFLAIPILASFKIFCDHFPAWQKVGRFLSL